MNLKLLEINRDYIERNINYKKNLKKKIYKKINYQVGGKPNGLNLDKIENLTNKLKKLKETGKLEEQYTKLNLEINKINQYIEKNENINIENLDLEKIIKNANMLVITKEDAQKINKKNLEIRASVEKELEPFQKENLESIKLIKDILDESFSLYSNIKISDKQQDESEFTGKLLKIKGKLNDQIKQNMSFYTEINKLEKFNILNNFDFNKESVDNKINVESTNPIYYYKEYYNNAKITNKKDFVSKFDIKGKIPEEIASFFNDKKFRSDRYYDIDKKNIELFNNYKDRFDIFEIKKYLNSIFPDLLLQESDILEDRIDNTLLKTDDIQKIQENNIIDVDGLKDLFVLPSQDGGGLLDDLTCIIKQANTEILKLETIKKDLVTIVNRYNFEMNKLAYHNIFMIGVFNELFTSNPFLSINYMNSGLILYYNNIVDKILEEINKNSDNNLILYFKKYHFLNLEIIKKILEDSLGKLNGDNKLDIINIRTSGQNVRYAYLILNFLNTNLNNYFLESNTNVTIYARINDWGNIKEKLFTVNPDKYKILNVDKEICKLIEKVPTPSVDQKIMGKQYNFTYVFGDGYNNSVISTYMGLETLLSQKKSLAMITYGYSGTGKTYTLFGNKDGGGMLQNTISRIKGLTKVYLRIFEIYGRGFQYPFYWDEKTKYQYIYDYKIDVKNNQLKLKNPSTVTHKDGTFETFMENNYSTYVSLDGQNIDGQNINETLKTLEHLVSEIDEIRKKNKRIRETPNNIESSRSIIVYDFTFIIDETEVYFLIMDLPGRENIEKTYIDNYVRVAEKIIESNVGSKSLTKVQTTIYSDISKFIGTYTNYHEYIKMLLFATSMQPLLIPIIDPEGFLQAIRTISKDENNYIIEEVKKLPFNNADKPNTEPLRKYITDDIFTIDMQLGKPIQLKTIKEVNGTSEKMQLMTRKEDDVNDNFIIANWGIFYMNIVITQNKFEVLESIIKYIIDKRFNDYIKRYCDETIDRLKYTKTESDNLKELQKYKDLLIICKKNYYDYLEKNKPTEFNDLEFIKNSVLYDYFMTPYEGLYINENIVGIIKYCEKINSSDHKSEVKSQDPNLNFNLQKIICRGTLLNPEPAIIDASSSLPDQTIKDKISHNLEKLDLEYDNGRIKLIHPPIPNTHPLTYTNKYMLTGGIYKVKKTLHIEGERNNYNIYPLLSSINTEYKFNFDNMERMYIQLKEYYNPSRIYNDGEDPTDKSKEKKEILIAKILKPYIGIENPRIKDFKIFYLFSNTNLDIKCYAQADLLELTKNFIEAIVHE